MVTYELVEFSEINCDVYLDAEGLLDVTPHDPEQPYAFAYFEIYDDGKKEYNVWHSHSTDNQLKEIIDYEIDKNIDNVLKDLGFEVFKWYKEDSGDDHFSFDSNHGSDV